MSNLILKLVLEHGLEEWLDWKTCQQIALVSMTMLQYASDIKLRETLSLKNTW